MTYTRGLRKYISVIRFPVIIKILFCSENGTPASFSTRALSFGSVFWSPYWKTKKTCQGTVRTNLESVESLNNIYPRSFHSVVWKEKKLTHKNSPPVKIGSPFIIVNSTWFPKSWHNPSGGGGGTQQVFYGEAPAPTFNPLPLYKLFFTRKVPFSFTLFWQMVPLSFTKFIRTFHPF